MCLERLQPIEQALKGVEVTDGKITAWKCVGTDSMKKKITPLHRRDRNDHNIPQTPFQPGVNKSQPVCIPAVEGRPTYTSGFHCFLRQGDANRIAMTSYTRKTIQVLIDPKDIIHAGFNYEGRVVIVAATMEITPEEYNRAVEG